MKKISVLLLLLVVVSLLTGTLAFAQEEDYGTVTLMEQAPAPEEGDANSEVPLEDIAPFIPEGMDKVVVGEDDRTTIKNTFSYPYSAIAYLKVKGQCGCDWVATGFMIRKNVMLTAAHCIVCADHGKLCEKMTAYFGYKSDKNYQLKYNSGFYAWWGTDFDQGDGTYEYDFTSMEHDYAYLILNKDVGNHTGWFGWRSHRDSDFASTPCCVTGYRDGVMKMDYGYVYPYADSPYLMSYNMDTQPGNSGGPVYDYDYNVIGINVAENWLHEVNVARKLTPDLVRYIHQHTD